MMKLDSKENIDREIKDNKMTLIYFGSETCGVCVDIKPKIAELLEKYPNINGIEVDSHASRKLSAQYSIFTIPVIVVFAEGKEVIREARHISMMDIEERVKRYYDMVFE